MVYNNPIQIKGIVEMCDNHISIQYSTTYKISAKDIEWKTGVLIGIKRFANDFMFIIFDGHEKYVKNVMIE